MITIIRTMSDNADFQQLVKALDIDLKVRDGEEHAFYAQFNGLDMIRHVIVAYQGSHAVGCGAIKAYDSETMEIKRMFVVTEERSKGIASIVLSALEDWANELGCKKCILETGNKQPEAIALYFKNDYVRIPNYAQYAGIENSVCLEKRLFVE